MKNLYHNPVVHQSLPDPTVVRAADGYFYLYATEDTKNVPIFQSKDLVKWKQVGTVFRDDTHPKFVDGGAVWAPDINYVGGRYVLYYALSVWGGEWTCGIGVATADSPAGPFTDRGKLFISSEIGVQNSIDPFFISDGGHNYLFWGSFHGIYGIELSSDGLSVLPGAVKQKIAGTMMEAAYIHKHGGYYYLFGSNGTCCEGADSKYQIIYGRSENLFGPYVNKEGQSMMDNHFNVLIKGDAIFAGPGHNAEFMEDDNGDDWMLYHAFQKANANAGRQLMLDKVEWRDGWPFVENYKPSSDHAVPVFRASTISQVPLADPFIMLDGDTYYAYGTHSDNGIEVYTSSDLRSWTSKGLALNKRNTSETKWFWAPEVYRIGNDYYIHYSANEHLYVAKGSSPLGPFTQIGGNMMESVLGDEKCIDSSVLFDDDGKGYFYFVRFNDGNNIWVCELESDMITPKSGTLKKCINVTQPWEQKQARVCEGPNVIKHDGRYYLTYSANDYRSQDYAVGYATATSPLGPWTKYAGNPILHKVENLVGTGHHSLFSDKNGGLRMVFHAHHSLSEVQPRCMYIGSVAFEGDKLVMTQDRIIRPVLK